MDEELADQIWNMWDRIVIDDEFAAIAWLRRFLQASQVAGTEAS